MEVNDSSVRATRLSEAGRRQESPDVGNDGGSSLRAPTRLSNTREALMSSPATEGSLATSDRGTAATFLVMKLSEEAQHVRNLDRQDQAERRCKHRWERRLKQSGY